MVELTKIAPNPRNPNRHSKAQVELLAKVIKATGWRSPITVSNRSGLVVKGHGRLEAAKLLGVDKVTVDFQDYDSDQAETADLLADNRLAELSDPDNGEIAALLKELQTAGHDTSLAGFVDDELEKLLAKFNLGDKQVDAEPRIDEAKELAKKWKVKTGQLWQLGDHRVICGDSSDRKIIEKVMGGDIGDLIWTDPPYGVSYGSKIESANAMGYRVRDIQNDDLTPEKLTVLIQTVYKNLAAVTSSRCAIYAACPPGTLLPAAIAAFAGSGFDFRWQLVWLKDALVLSRADYHFRHENILYGWKTSGAHYFTSERNHDSIFEVPRPKRSEQHPTMKPPELIAKMIRNSSRIGNMVIDPFNGSGSTLMACLSTNRNYRGIEIDPGYCAVTIQRWLDATGIQPTLAP